MMRLAYKRYFIAMPPPVPVVSLKRFQQMAKTRLISLSHGFKKLDNHVRFPEYLDLTPFLALRKEDYGLEKIRKDGVDEEKEGEGGGEAYVSVVCRCGAHWELSESLSVFSSFSWG